MSRAVSDVLSVGSCSSDDARLARVIACETGARMQTAYTAEEALALIEKKSYALILVNRMIDGDGSSGTDFIAEVRQAGITTPLMLVSDYADAQARAIANGALPGFGKSDLFQPQTADLFRRILSPAASA